MGHVRAPARIATSTSGAGRTWHFSGVAQSLAGSATFSPGRGVVRNAPSRVRSSGRTARSLSGRPLLIDCRAASASHHGARPGRFFAWPSAIRHRCAGRAIVRSAEGVRDCSRLIVLAHFTARVAAPTPGAFPAPVDVARRRCIGVRRTRPVRSLSSRQTCALTAGNLVSPLPIDPPSSSPLRRYRDRGLECRRQRDPRSGGQSWRSRASNGTPTPFGATLARIVSATSSRRFRRFLATVRIVAGRRPVLGELTPVSFRDRRA